MRPGPGTPARGRTNGRGGARLLGEGFAQAYPGGDSAEAPAPGAASPPQGGPGAGSDRGRPRHHRGAPLRVCSPGHCSRPGAERRQRAGYSPWRRAGVSGLERRERSGAASPRPGPPRVVGPQRMWRAGGLFRSLRLLMETEARDPGVMHVYWSLRSRDRKCPATDRPPHAHWLSEPGSPASSRHAVPAAGRRCQW